MGLRYEYEGLARPAAEDDLLPWAAKHGPLVIAYSPLAQGFLSGRYGAADPPAGSARRFNPLFLPKKLERGAALLQRLR